MCASENIDACFLPFATWHHFRSAHGHVDDAFAHPAWLQLDRPAFRRGDWNTAGVDAQGKWRRADILGQHSFWLGDFRFMCFRRPGDDFSGGKKSMSKRKSLLALEGLSRREILQQLLLFNLFLQLLDALNSYRILAGTALLMPPWSALLSLLYNKSLACLLLLLIVWLGNRKPQLAAQALIVTASVYTGYLVIQLYGQLG